MKRKTSASFKFAVDKKKHSDNNSKYQQVEDLNCSQQAHATEQQSEPGSSCSIQPVPEENTVFIKPSILEAYENCLSTTSTPFFKSLSSEPIYSQT